MKLTDEQIEEIKKKIQTKMLNDEYGFGEDLMGRILDETIHRTLEAVDDDKELADVRLFKQGMEVEDIDLNKLGCHENRTQEQIESYVRGYFWRGYRIRIKPPLDRILWMAMHDVVQAEHTLLSKEIDGLVDESIAHETRLREIRDTLNNAIHRDDRVTKDVELTFHLSEYVKLMGLTEVEGE